MLRYQALLGLFVTNTLCFVAVLKTGQGEKVIAFNAHLDFGFDSVLISKHDIDCVKEHGCLITDDASKDGKYVGKIYSYQEATLTVNVARAAPKEPVRLDLFVRLTDLRKSIIGLNPDSSLKASLKGVSNLQIDVYSGELSFIENQPLTPLSIYKKDGLSVYYYDAVINYSISSLFYYKSSEMPARFCFHDQDATVEQDFFFLGNEYYQIDWDTFLDTFGGIGDKRWSSSVVSTGDPNKGAIEYDSGVFEGYDGDPMKSFAWKTFTFCDLLIGKFAAHRSTMKVVLNLNTSTNMLEAGITTKTQDYIHFSKGYLSTFSYLLIFISMAYLAYLTCGKETKVQNDWHNRNPQIYRSLNN